MKKIYALFISGLIALYFSVSLLAQSSEDPERDKWQKPEEVVKSLNLKPGDVVADIGAGTGYFTRYFAIAVSPGGKAIGLDIKPSLVQNMKEDARIGKTRSIDHPSPE